MSLGDVELSDGLANKMACELAGAYQVGEEVAKSCSCIRGKSVVQYESSRDFAEYES